MICVLRKIFVFGCWYYIILYTHLYCNDIKSNIAVMWWENRLPPQEKNISFCVGIQVCQSQHRTTDKGLWKMLFLPEVTIFSFRMKQIRGIKCASQAFSFSPTYESQSWNKINNAWWSHFGTITPYEISCVVTWWRRRYNWPLNRWFPHHIVRTVGLSQ